MHDAFVDCVGMYSMMWRIQQKKSENVFIYNLFFKSIFLMHLACPFKLLERVLSLEEELADHSLEEHLGSKASNVFVARSYGTLYFINF